MVTLFVGGFPLDMDEIELAKLFMPFGQVSTIKIVRDKKIGICKGYAFLEIYDQEAAQDIITNLDGALMGDRNLTVKVREDNPKTILKDFITSPNANGRVNYVKVQKSSEQEKKKRPRRPVN